MRAYLIPKAAPGQRYARTKDDAKVVSRAVGGTWELVEVPTDQAGLLDFLNELEQSSSTQGGERDQPDPAGGAPIGPFERENSPDVGPPPPPASLADTIGALTGAELARAVEAAVCRLGEPEGTSADAVQGMLRAGLERHPSRNAFYRGAARITLVAAEAR